jgi:hypothetical protein
VRAPARPELISLESGREPAVPIGSLSQAGLIPSGRSMGPVTYRVLLVEGATGGVGPPTANRVPDSNLGDR